MMVDYAHKQLEYAVQKWKDIEEINQRYIHLWYPETAFQSSKMRKNMTIFH